MASISCLSPGVLLLFVVLVTLGSVGAALGPGAVAAAPNSTQSPQTHTLVLSSTGQPTSYTLTVSGSLTAETTEAVDSVQGRSVTGRVGGIPWQKTSNDTRDVIQFTGRITDFQVHGSGLRLRLDGKQVRPASLRSTPQPTPTQTPPSTTARSPPSATPSPTATPVPTTSVSDTSVSSSSPESNAGEHSLEFGLLGTIMAGVVGLLAIGGIGVLLSLRRRP